MSVNQVRESKPERVEKQKEIWKTIEILDGIMSSIDRTIEILEDNISPVLRQKQDETPAINKGSDNLPDCKTLMGAKLSAHYFRLNTLQLSLEDLINRLEI